MQYKLTFIVAALLGVASAAVSFPESEMGSIEMKRALDLEQLEARDAGLDIEAPSLEKRACRENGCRCREGTPRGQYCGRCSQVISQGKGGSFMNDIFECNPKGGCCDYGKNTVCSNPDTYRRNCPK
jgi:hypothetical protein